MRTTPDLRQHRAAHRVRDVVARAQPWVTADLDEQADRAQGGRQQRADEGTREEVGEDPGAGGRSGGLHDHGGAGETRGGAGRQFLLDLFPFQGRVGLIHGQLRQQLRVTAAGRGVRVLGSLALTRGADLVLQGLNLRP